MEMNVNMLTITSHPPSHPFDYDTFSSLISLRRGQCLSILLLAGLPPLASETPHLALEFVVREDDMQTSLLPLSLVAG